MDDEDIKPLRVVDGTVKWFDPARGFGFVVADSGGPDILLHANVLRNFGQGSVVDGALVSLSVQETPRGLQAIEVLSIAPPPCGSDTPLSDLEYSDPEQLASAPLVPARMKWFDKNGGYGFIASEAISTTLGRDAYVDKGQRAGFSLGSLVSFQVYLLQGNAQ